MNPTAVGIAYADEFYPVNTIDEEGTAALAERIRPDGIMTLATDLPMRSLAVATSRIRRPGISYDTAVKATDKGEMIKAFEAAGVEHPWYFILKSKEDLTAALPKITYPCVTKPTDNAGNRGVSFVNDEAELLSLYDYSHENSHSGDVIIEEYMEGQEVSVEIIVYLGTAHVLAVTDKLTQGTPYFVEIGHSEQSQLGEENVARIKDLATRAVKAIGLDNSPAHVEIMLTKDGPKMVELGARMGGGCITTHLVPLSTGIDMIKSVMDLAMGKEPDITPKFDKGSALRHIVGLEGEIVSVDGLDEARAVPCVTEVTMLKGVGDKVGYFKNGADRIGYVIAQGKDAADAVRICEKAMKLICIKTK
jgi:biotin carboxylase